VVRGPQHPRLFATSMICVRALGPVPEQPPCGQSALCVDRWDVCKHRTPKNSALRPAVFVSNVCLSPLVALPDVCYCVTNGATPFRQLPGIGFETSSCRCSGAK